MDLDLLLNFWVIGGTITLGLLYIFGIFPVKSCKVHPKCNCKKVG
jgi:hypothetical protein